MVFDGETLNDTDRFIIKSLVLDPERIDELGRKMKKRIGCIMERYTRFLELDKSIYTLIISQLYLYSQVLVDDFALDPFTGKRKEVVRFEAD